jgi:dGTPase
MFNAPSGAERDNLLLAPYAMATRFSRGRQHREPEHPFRPLFQRDRERVVHCSAFRRLMLKTQVLAAATNDHHRTRLTHTLEVAQVSRTIARQLGLQEDLTEAIALSHDLGHPPFGHAGERALDECMADYGGFDHNLHSLRIVDFLESPYPDRPGLNLSWEVREAMAHHSGRRDHPSAKELFAAGEPTLEARVVDAADSLAYDAHDLDDALGYGLITLAELETLDFWRVGADRVRRETPGLPAARFRRGVVRALIEWQVTDLLSETQNRIERERITSLADVRRVPDLVGNGEPAQRAKEALEVFLHERVYRHPRVRAMQERGQRCVHGLFSVYRAAPTEMSEPFARRVGDETIERTACDYVAGMTDRFARQEYERLFPNDRQVR